MCIRDSHDVLAHRGGAGKGHHVDARIAHELVADLARILRCLLYTSDAADERSSVDLGGRRIIKKKNK